MDPLEFEGQSGVLGAPAGWNQTEPIKCGGLPIARRVVEGMPAMQSYWKPSADELSCLVNGGHVRLTVYGTGHPPVWLDAERCDAFIERVPK